MKNSFWGNVGQDGVKNLSMLFLIVIFLLSSCNSKTEHKSAETRLITAEVKKDSVDTEPNESSYVAESDLLANIPVRHFPITDSTKFENFEKLGIPDNGFLKRIKFKPEQVEATNLRINYKIPFSDKFTAVVVSYQSGEYELFTSLLTVSKENEIIDKLEIAYDEIAESAFGKMSKIKKDTIVITDSNWMSEEQPTFETKTYILQPNGKFRMMQPDNVNKI